MLYVTFYTLKTFSIFLGAKLFFYILYLQHTKMQVKNYYYVVL